MPEQFVQAEQRTNEFGFNKNEFVNGDFREALLALAGTAGAINTRRLGGVALLKRHVLASGHRFEQCGTNQGVAEWRLVEVDRPPPADDARP